MEYTINFILALYFGIFSKIYDDIIDNKININFFYIDILKYIVITLFSILFYTDIVFSILCFEAMTLSFCMDYFYTNKLNNNIDNNNQKNLLAMNDNIWIYSFFLSGGFILFYLFIYIKNNNLNNIDLFDYKNITFFIIIVINSCIVLSDIYFTPEHYSNKKLYARIFVFILFCIIFYYMTFYSSYIYEGCYSYLLLYIGFLVTSICSLILTKLNYPFQIYEKVID